MKNFMTGVALGYGAVDSMGTTRGTLFSAIIGLGGRLAINEFNRLLAGYNPQFFQPQGNLLGAPQHPILEQRRVAYVEFVTGLAIGVAVGISVPTLRDTFGLTPPAPTGPGH